MAKHSRGEAHCCGSPTWHTPYPWALKLLLLPLPGYCICWPCRVSLNQLVLRPPDHCNYCHCHILGCTMSRGCTRSRCRYTLSRGLVIIRLAACNWYDSVLCVYQCVIVVVCVAMQPCNTVCPWQISLRGQIKFILSRWLALLMESQVKKQTNKHPGPDPSL